MVWLFAGVCVFCVFFLPADPIGTEVLTVSAVDPDSSSTIRYSIDANSIVAVNDRGAQVFTTDVDTTVGQT